MCNNCHENTIPNLNIGVNLLRNDRKAFRLPVLNEEKRTRLEDGTTIELVILEQGNFSIECFEYPIRFGQYVGNRLFFNTTHDYFHINPKFIFDTKNKLWVLMNAGYVCFAEMELEHKSNHKLYGEKDA